jgi:hypothetical protein
MSIYTHIVNMSLKINFKEMNKHIQIKSDKLIQVKNRFIKQGNSFLRFSLLIGLCCFTLFSKAQISTNFSNFTFYDSNSITDDLHYDYGWTRSSSNVTLQSNGMVLEPTVSNVPENFTTGAYNLSGTDSIKFTHRITNTGGGGSKTLVIKLINVMTNAEIVIDSIKYVNASQQNFETKTLNVSQVGLFRIQFEFINTNIVGSSPQVIVNTFFSSSTPMMLSVNIEDFYAELKENNVVIHWEAFSEEHIKSYELEFAFNLEQFEKFAVVNPKGSSLNSATYEFVHYRKGTASRSEVIYYRIKIFDETGNYTYSKTIELFNKSNSSLSKVSYSNPVATSLSITTEDSEFLNLIIIKDNLGRNVLIKENNLNQSNLQINTVSLVPGNYYLLLNYVNGAVETHKLVKL